MRFIHVADIHASRERLPQTLSILNTLTERCKKGDIDFIIFAGDFWDSTITATKGSGFSDILAAMKELEQCVTRIYMIYGTPSHEPNGSLDAFDSSTISVINGKRFVSNGNCRFVFISEPRRSNYITSSSKETDEAINADIKDWLEKSAKWTETLEDNYIHKPLVVVYHGEVKGAVYQNGVLASSPTAIPKELLESLHADYYAFGHIHAPQEVFPNAWYSGSACPKDFGETHDGHYNLVTIDKGETKVEEVSFGLPLFLTIKGDPRKVKSGNMDKTNIRFIFDVTKEEKKSLNIKQLADEIKERTNALSVKLEPTVIEIKTVSTSKVSKSKSIVEKLSAYAKEAELTVPKYTKELLLDIQDNLTKLAYPQHSFELLSLSLRGAIGIRNGQHKEDFELNFEQYEDGVVCLVGENGRGKTTVVENCHPYPCMLTRDGTLKDHFYLRDSHRILIYRDENGLYYKISMLIDGKTSTGKTSYFVETSTDRETWKPNEVDGSLESYKQWVERTFGSIDVFLRTAFFAKEQTKTPDISATTKSERMELLSKLAGTDHLKDVSLLAREERKGIEKVVEKIETEIESYSRYEDNIKLNKQDIISWNHELKGQDNVVQILEKELAELKLKDAEYQKSKALYEANSALYEQYKKEFEEKKEKYECIEYVIENYNKVVMYKEYKKQIADNTSKIKEYQTSITDKTKKIKKLNDEISALEKEYSEIEIQYNKIESEIKIVESQIVPVDKKCPTCGALLSEDKISELVSVVKENEKKLEKLKEERIKYIPVNKDEDWKYAPRKSEVEHLNEDIDYMNYAISAITAENTMAELYINAHEELKEYVSLSKESLEESVKKLEKELDDLQVKMDDIVESETLEDVSEELEKKEAKVKVERNRLSDIASNIKAAEKENEKYEKELKSVEGKKSQLKKLNDQIKAYLFIEEAFSNNGIPAIELRESAPEISDIANKILADSYGNKFEIRFGSTSELKTKRKANEDFNIIVYDTENGDEKTIDLVSSGERIWIKQALFYAFSIVQMNRTGFNFRTRLIDESDGSLDGGLRPKYLNMVTSAHEQASARLTILITHSQEIKDIATQIIEI